jgi:hypothetical protein
VPDKAERVFKFHRQTLQSLADMLAAAGLEHPSELGPHHLVRRVSATQIKQFSELHIFLRPGELVDGSCTEGFYCANWARASADSFDALPV